MALSPEQIQQCKSLLEANLQEQQSLLIPLNKSISVILGEGNKVSDELLNQRNKCENKISSIKKSLEMIEDGSYGYDIHTKHKIPFERLLAMPDLKVNNGPTPRPATSFPGAGKSHLRT